MNQRAPRIAIVAGETSGDRLGATLIESIRARVPGAQFAGMAGPRMRAAGCAVVADIEQLSVMGLVEVLRSYPRLHRLRQRLVRHFIAERPDVVVGIDVPDFNLGLERQLKEVGIPTAHYVCPQVWAWREGRARALGRAADRLLAVLPFEVDFFSTRGVPTDFVGHPLAEQLPLEPDRRVARSQLGIVNDGPVLALMPGSRDQELRRLLPVFAAAAQQVRAQRAGLALVACVAREKDVERVREALGALPCQVFVGQSHQVLTAADVALVASGTVTLEAMLCHTPMVVGYRLAALSYFIIRRMIRIPRVALPNILAGRELVPELIQHDLQPEGLATAVLDWLDDAQRRADFVAAARELHLELRAGCAPSAADIVLDLAGYRP